MPEVVNTSFLGESKQIQDDSQNSAETMIKVDDVSMVFNMASETMNNLKEYAIALVRRELRFKEFRALDHISLEVKKGDVFGILGTNGSGKSTLLKIIAGVLEPSEGTCTVNGSIAPLIELGAGFDMELTARENIFLNGALLGYSKHFIEQHFDEIVEFAEIEKFLDMPLKNYSSGMVARIAFAIATVIVPEILIVDEVLSVGDFMFQQKCERRIQSLIKDHGVTVLIVSHSNDQIERLCNKAIWIEKGHERIAGSAKEVCQVYRILGGHIGSAESEQRVFEMIKAPLPEKAEEINIQTIAGDNRFGSAIKLMERTFSSSFSPKALILSATDNLAYCMMANSLASALDTFVMLSKKDSLPDTTRQKIKEILPNEIYILSDEAISQSLIKEIESIQENAKTIKIIPLNAPSLSKLAEKIYCLENKPLDWGKTVFLAHENCEYDLLSFSPYSFGNKLPIFFNEKPGVISESTKELIKQGDFSRFIVLGNTKDYPDETISEISPDSTEVIRIFGSSYLDANSKINDWIASNTESFSAEIIAISVWQPADALAIASYASKNKAALILVDPQDLDSITYAFDFLESYKAPSTLTFIGSSTSFSENDKELLSKAFLKTRQ